MTQQARIGVAIVDDHTLFRHGLSALLRELTEIDVLFEAGNGLQLQQRLQNSAIPDVVLMDINMPGMDGYATTRWLRASYPGVHIIALSMFDDDQAVIGMIRAGACGYVLKESDPREVRQAILTAAATGVYLNEHVSGRLLRTVSDPVDQPSISKNELEFLKLCCSELTYKEIADRMTISPRTVDNYREALFYKLNLKSRTGLVLYALKNRLVEI